MQRNHQGVRCTIVSGVPPTEVLVGRRELQPPRTSLSDSAWGRQSPKGMASERMSLREEDERCIWSASLPR